MPAAQNLKLLCFDLDGTVLAGGQPLSPANLQTLQALHGAGVVLAAASGRNRQSLHKVLSPDTPLDYAIFSTGAGILRWEGQSIIRRQELSAAQVATALQVLLERKIDVMVQDILPDNHIFQYRHFSQPENCPTDFFRRVEIYRGSCRQLPEPCFWQSPASQLLAVLPPDEQLFLDTAALLQDFSVIRSTSPLDHTSIWMEIFAPGVNKSSGAAWLAGQLAASQGRAVDTYALGNDHNDLDLLHWAGQALVAAHSPGELQRHFSILSSPPEMSLPEAAERWHLLA
ncbi:MAG: HAD family phosphatase [Oligosphaeraceae bacterium]|nr:HAD family phosphatase [Oligosphaeraceae bacterium]